jgi:hypothetical protein
MSAIFTLKAPADEKRSPLWLKGEFKTRIKRNVFMTTGIMSPGCWKY